jgi:hypothetical protein
MFLCARSCYLVTVTTVLLLLYCYSHTLVKDTATWTVGKICELHVRQIPPNVSSSYSD